MFKNRAKILLDRRDKDAPWLAKKTGLDLNTAHRIVNDPYANMQLATAAKICNALGVSGMRLLAWEPKTERGTDATMEI